MTQPVGPPAAPSIQNIAERAERIIKRAEANTKDEVKNLAPQNNQEKKQKQTSETVRLDGQVERLPAELANAPMPQTIEGEVITVDGRTLTLQTPQGRVEVRAGQPAQVQKGQTVTVEIPPKTRTGDTVRVSYVLSTSEVRLPPDVQLPPTNATRDFPPVYQGQTVLATPQPLSNYTAYASGTAVPTPSNYPAEQLLPIIREIPAVLESAARTTPVTQKLQTVIQNYDLAQYPAAELIDAPAVPRPATTMPFTNTAATATASQTDAAENVLTQVPIKQPAEGIQKTTQKYSTNIIAALDAVGQTNVTATQNTGNPFIKGEHQAQNILRSFQQLDVLAVIPKDTPRGDLQGKIAGALSQALGQSKDKSVPALPKGEIVLAQVAGVTQNGQTIVSLPPSKDSANVDPRLFYIQTQVFAPEGTQLLVNLSEIPVGNVVTNPQHVSALPPQVQSQLSQYNATASGSYGALLPPAMAQPIFAQTWPAMQETLDVLLQSAPQVAQNVQNTLPSPSPRMVSSALFFIAALKLGNIENWLGNKTLDAIEANGKKGLVQRLAGDFSRLSSQVSEQTSGQWKTLTLPMLFEGDISNIQLHIRPDDHAEREPENQDDDGIKKTRFVLDLKLSRMGAMQIDGLLTPKTLDMILRNQDRISENDRQELMKIFNNTLELTGLKGSLSFQNKPENWVRVSQA